MTMTDSHTTQTDLEGEAADEWQMDSSELELRERCPKCGDLLEHESKNPLEEFCIAVTCDYYRAEGADGEVIRE